MDDWPRSEGNYYSKYNIDASAWMQFMTNQLSHLFKLQGNEVKAKFYGQYSSQIRKAIFEKMFNEKDLIFYDLLENEEQ